MEEQLAGSWQMTREYTTEDDQTGFTDFTLVLREDRSFSWSWQDRDSGVSGNKVWIGRWWVSSRQGKPLLNMRGDQPFLKRFFYPQNDSAHFVDSVTDDEFVWSTSEESETFRRIKVSEERTR